MLFGFLIFVAIQLSQGKDIIQTVKFTLSLSIPDGYQLSTPFPDEISVLVRGPKKKIQRMIREERFLSIEAKTSRVRTLGKEDFPMLKSLEVVKIIPETLNISIEPSAEKSVPVILNRMKTLPDHLVYENAPEVSPERVTIVGPRSYLNLIDQVHTQPLDQSRLKKSERIWVKLRKDHPLIHFKNLQSVRVSYTLQQRLIKRGISDIFITFINGDPEQLQFKRNLPIEVVIEAPYRIAKSLKSSDFQAFIDLKAFQKEGELFKRSLTVVTSKDQVKVLYILPEEIVFKQKKNEQVTPAIKPMPVIITPKIIIKENNSDLEGIKKKE